MRLFIAVDVEDPVILSRLESVRDAVMARGGRFKPVEAQNMHFTLRFLGEVDERLVDEIYEAMRKVRFNAFKARLKGLGAFPSLSRPRVIWVGVEEGYEELRDIRIQLDSGLRRMGFKPEKEEFVPHVTLLRVKSRIPPGTARILAEYSDYDFGVMEVRSIRLKQSILTPRGPIYRTLREVEAA